jgi:hypothetical protein
MKRNVILLLACLSICVMPYLFGSSAPNYGDTPIPQGGALGWDTIRDVFRAVSLASDGSIIVQTPAAGLTIGTFTPTLTVSTITAKLGATSGFTAVYAVGSPSAATTIAVSTTCTDFSVFNLGTDTVWLNMSGAAGVSNCIPIRAGTYLSRDASFGMSISLNASTTQTIIYAEGRR